MLDFDRRTILIGSLLTAGGAHPASMENPHEDHARRVLRRRLGMLLDLENETSWLLAERLKWRSKWPAVLVDSGCVSHISGMSERRPCRSTLPDGGMLAIYSWRFPEVSSWRRVAGAEVAVLGVHMTSYRSGGQLACLIQSKGEPSPSRIALEV